MSDAETIHVYDTRADDYARAFGDRDAPSAELQRFMQACAPGGKVLDLGCGPGGSSAFLAQAGFDVLATDASREMVARAASIPGVSARQATFADLDAEDAFDGIWANFSLLHAPRSEMPAHLDAIAKALKAGGVFHIGLKLGTGAERDDIGRFYTYYSEHELEVLLSQVGFSVIERDHGSGRGLDGNMSDWIVLLARLDPSLHHDRAT